MALHNESRSLLTMSGWMAVAMATGVLLCLWPSAASARSLKEAQAAFDKKQYQEALDLVEQVTKEQGPQPEARRLKIHSLILLAKPKDALVEYEHLERDLKQDDRALLKEVALGFVYVLLKDMREQMRGAAYTALKDVDSPEMIPALEDGLSDGS